MPSLCLFSCEVFEGLQLFFCLVCNCENLLSEKKFVRSGDEIEAFRHLNIFIVEFLVWTAFDV